MPAKVNLSLNTLLELRQSVSLLLEYLRQEQHLFSPMERSQQLRSLIPAKLKSHWITLYPEINRMVQLYDEQCKQWLKTKLTLEQKEAIFALQKELEEIRTLQKAALTVIMSEYDENNKVLDLDIADIERTLLANKKIVH
jgi:hypothetical protein